MGYEIRELGVGGILDQAISVTKDHFWLFVKIVLVLFLPFALLSDWLAPPEIFEWQANEGEVREVSVKQQVSPGRAAEDTEWTGHLPGHQFGDDLRDRQRLSESANQCGARVSTRPQCLSVTALDHASALARADGGADIAGRSLFHLLALVRFG
jgi:hypothetical protein